MPLGDTSAFEEWVRKENPQYAVGRIVNWWIIQAGDNPWLVPSEPWPEMCDIESQVRTAVVPGTSVEVIYRETYVSQGVGPVDLIVVRTLRPEEQWTTS